ncbi:hypothetical protein [uncultured Brachybacterium sp.]|uniref:hypothetical protein n=1 Tax=uncultured Brachybacterium sp. TaxID=189680 RepID=UPI0026244085|nr:hypothetical protein [uncultured Brachybacterium sp.]
MKKRMAVLALLGVALLGLTSCTDAEKEEAVRPVVQEVMESLLSPLVDDDVQSE